MEIAVCDDNQLFVDEIKAQLHSLEMANNISAFTDMNAFCLSVKGGKRYDAILMDIDWHGSP